jgi:hypothetical protein
MTMPHAVLVIASIVAGLVLACSDDETSGGGAGSAGAPSAGSGGQGGAQTSGASGSGGTSAGTSAGETSAGTSAGGAACHGDAANWTELLSASRECEDDSDCCVVVNECLAEARVVHLDDFEAAQSAWPYCDDECNDCVAPRVFVACVDGACAGSLDDESGEPGVSHCGNEAGTIDPTSTEVNFGCQ